MNTPNNNTEKLRNPVGTERSNPVDAPLSRRAAGILMILAGPASLGLTTTDPTNPSGGGVLMMLLAFAAARYSFKGKRSRALVCTRIFVVITALSAIMGIVDSKFTGNILVYPIEFLICGGLGCLLGLCALGNLRNTTSAI